MARIQLRNIDPDKPGSAGLQLLLDGKDISYDVKAESFSITQDEHGRAVVQFTLVADEVDVDIDAEVKGDG